MKIRDVLGYEGLYRVSSTGIVFGKRGGPLSPYELDGYRRVLLRKNGIARQFFVHTLVARAFLGVPRGKNVHHISGDRSDNRTTNLQYMDPQEHFSCHKRGENHPQCKLTDADCAEIRRLHRERSLSSYELAEMFPVSRRHISHILRGEKR